MAKQRGSSPAQTGKLRWGYLSAGAVALAIGATSAGCTTAGVDGGPGPGPLAGVRIRSTATDRCLTAMRQPSPAGEVNPSCTEPCLTVVPGELAVIATGCSTTNPFQRWDLESQDDEDLLLQSVGATESLDEEMCLTLGVPEPGAIPTLNPCDGSPSQAWSVGAASGSPGQFLISLGGQYLEAGSGGPAITVGPPSGGPRQRWKFTP